MKSGFVLSCLGQTRLVTTIMAATACILVADVTPAAPHIPGYERLHLDQPSVEAGMLLLGELNCVACHQTDEQTRAKLDSKQAPILDAVSMRIKPTYLAKYIAETHASDPRTTMPSLFATVDAAERSRQALAIAHFLAAMNAQGPQQDYAPIGGQARGQQLYQTVGCTACHGSRLEGSETTRTDKPLGDLAAKYTLPSLADFLRDPLHVRRSGRMPSLNLTGAESRDIAAFLLPHVPEKSGMLYKYYEGSWNRLPDFKTLAPKATGEVERIDISPKQRGDHFALRFEGMLVIETDGEYTFHLGSDDGSRLTIDGTTVVDHDGVHGMQFKSGKIELARGKHLLVADVFEAGGQEEIRVEFEGPGIARQDVSPAIVAADPAEPLEPISFSVDAQLVSEGRRLFSTVGCAACHELRESPDDDPISNRLTAKPFEALTPDQGCLSAVPSQGAADFRLDDHQRRSLNAAIRSTDKRSEPTPEDRIHRRMTQLNCYACHQRDGTGGPFAAQQSLFIGTQPEMGDEGRLPPPLDGVGGKLTSVWLAHTLAEGAKDRPYMLTRMPGFGKSNTEQLRRLLESTDHLPDLEKKLPSSTKSKIAGWKMVGNQGFGCIKCHTFGRFKATGVQSIDLTIMHKRLRPEWFVRYVDTPQAFRRGTRMPDAWPSDDGNSLLPKILDGQNATQIAAVWDYLSDGVRARTPVGLATSSMELIPTHEAIIYRNFIQGAGPRAIGVGYPEQFNLAFDANRLRLALLWQGPFIDASMHWRGRGSGFQNPAGQAILKLPSDTTVAILRNSTTAWPKTDPRTQGARFRGYRLSKDRRPTFLYDVGGIRVEDFPTPVENETNTRFLRTLTLRTENPTNDAYVLAAAGEISVLDDGWFAVDERYKVRAVGGTAIVRESGDRQECIVPIHFDGKTAELILEYDW